MSKTIYTLKIHLADFPAGSIVVDDNDTWRIGNKSYNHRGSIGEGEFALLLDYLVKTKSITILEEVE